MSEETFYDHFHKDKPTGPGMWLSMQFCRRIFQFAGMKKGQSVLEIGPGRGVFADVCRAEGVQYTAIEPNHHLANALESRGVEVVRAFIPPMPSFEKSFDHIVMINFLEHMDGTKEAMDLADRVREILSPGGSIVVCCPDYLNMRQHFFNVDFSHGYVTTQRRLAQLLTSTGYDQTRSRYLAGPIGGCFAVMLAGVMAWMPFGMMASWFPKCPIMAKLYKIQLSLTRKILIVGKRPA